MSFLSEEPGFLRVKTARAARAWFVGKVKAVRQEKAGTRSQTAVYELDVVSNIEGDFPPDSRLKHFGLPELESGHAYVFGAMDTRRFHAAWELGYAVEVKDGALEQATQELRDRLAGGV